MTKLTDRTPPVPVAVVIALGSNLGNRALNIRRAILHIGRSVDLVKQSSIIETDAVGGPAGSPPFLNAAVAGHTRLPPRALLDTLLAIERDLGRRRPDARNAPRTIDLDLIFYGGFRLAEPGLQIPHPRWREREFVRIPLREMKLSWADD
jgi:2-amino-4-hydroxy-6-hydroxymethyldihydropteridine diphosphokinase